MIFIGLFLIIAIVVISLNIHNHSNLDKIEEYLKKNNCADYVYSRGSYKALCENNLLEISNSFIVNIEENTISIKYEDIKEINIKDTKILVNNEILEFKDKEDLDSFLGKLKTKLVDKIGDK